MKEPAFLTKLKSFVVFQRTVHVLETGLYLFNRFALVLAIFVLADSFLDFERSFRWFLFISLGAYLTVLLAGRIFRARSASFGFSDYAARLDDKLKTNDLLLNALEFREPAGDWFKQALLSETDRKYSRTDLLKYTDFSALRREALRALITAVVFAAVIALIPGDTLYSSARLLMPWSNLEEKIFAFKYTVEPGDVTVSAGSSMEIRVVSSANLRQCLLYYKSGPRQFYVDEMKPLATNNLKSGTGAYSFTLREINQDVEYHVKMTRTGRNVSFDSRNFTVQALVQPVVSGVDVRYDYPDYTGLRPFVQKNSGNIEGPRGTGVTVMATGSSSFKSAWFVFDKSFNPAVVHGNHAEFHFSLEKDTEYFIRVLDMNGLTNAAPVRYPVRIIEDQKPEIRFVKPGHDIDISGSMTVPFELQARDDFLVHSIAFRWFVVRGTGRISDETNTKLLAFRQDKEVSVQFDFNLDEADLTPGDSAFYFAVVDDGYPYDDTHKVKSEVFKIRFPSVEDMYKQVDTEEDKSITDLKDVLDRQSEFSSKIDELKKKLAENRELNYVEKKQMESMLDKEQKLLEQTKKVADNINETVKKTEKNRLSSYEVVQKMMEVHKLVQEIADKDMQENINKLQEQLKNVNLTDQDRQNLSRQMDQQEMLRKLDNTLKMLKEVKKNRKLNGLVRKTDQLINRENEITKDTKDLDKKSDHDLKSLKDRQDENKQALADLKKDIDRMDQDNRETDPKFAEEMKKNSDMIEQKKMSENMDAVNDSVDKKDTDSSLGKQDQVRQDLMALKSSLNKNVKEKQEKSLEKIMAFFDELISGLVAVSSEQSLVSDYIDLKNNPSPRLFVDNSGSPESLQKMEFDLSAGDLAEKEIVLDRVLQSTKKRIRTELEKTLFLPEEFYRRFDEISFQMSAARKYLEDRNMYFADRASASVSQTLNLFILELLSIKENIRQQAQKQPGGQGQDMMDSLDQMSQSQESLNNSVQRMMGQKGQDGFSPEQQEYMKGLAYQQEMIKNSFQDLIQDNPESQKLLGDMKGLAKDLKDAADKLQKGELTQDLVDQQKRILKKLLDSQKSMKVQDLSRERESQQPDRKGYAIKNPGELQPDNNPENKNLERYRSLEKFPPEYRKIIENYLRKLAGE